MIASTIINSIIVKAARRAGGRPRAPIVRIMTLPSLLADTQQRVMEVTHVVRTGAGTGHRRERRGAIRVRRRPDGGAPARHGAAAEEAVAAGRDDLETARVQERPDAVVRVNKLLRVRR